ASWTEVEPAIFGTLLERALDPTERHALVAHYTPRAYVDRLVMPTVIDPLRAEWSNAQAAALLLANEANALDGKKRDDKLAEARTEVRTFHHRLCTARVLDPACGSGNFLYVTLEHLKRLEGEVLNLLSALGDSQEKLGLEGETVTLQQLRGIELNARAAALAELVLWIGYLQWQARTVGVRNIAEPVVHDYGNIENRDAVLAYDDIEPQTDDAGKVLTRWDGITHKTHPVTGLSVPDESAQTVQWRYINPRKAEWPQVDFIVGNPPFIGASTMRAALGDGYVNALRSTWPDVPESADFVMYWWQHAAQTVGAGQAQRFGFITTNSIKQTFNRRVVQAALPSVSLLFAIPDHPWVDSANGAAVRIAMTAAQAGPYEGRLLTVKSETNQDDGEVAVTFSESQGLLHADLRIGANVAAAQPLRANLGLSSPGVKLHGAGFIVTRDEARHLGLGTVPGLAQHIREYRNGRDLTASPRDVLVIDLFGLSAAELRQRFPAVYQWLLERVKPERDTNNRATYRDNWWIFGEPRKDLRPALNGLNRYIATVETTKHRNFQFLDATVLPDNMLIAVASDDAAWLGVLSTVIHSFWAEATGGSLGVFVGNIRYNKTRCFETFPFPSEDTGLTPELTDRIRALAEQIDAHRKQQQAAHPELTLTGLYNVLEKLRGGLALSAKDKTIHEQGLVAVLRTLHDELDTAVQQAYGWSDLGPVPWADEVARAAWTDTLLQRLVNLNTRRCEEEASGTIRWLRP
ncbi:MAG: class I SAM-dependent DNA methyltransferase, partial [Burkholderiaceae bacterium]